MLFFLRKLAEAVSLPIGLAMFLILAGIVLRRRLPAVLGVVLLFVCATAFAARLLTIPIERAYPQRTAASCVSADAIVTLSGGIVHGLTPTGVEWGDAAGRYLAAMEVARAQPSERLIFTGAPLGGGTGLTEGGILRHVAIEQGIAADRVLVTGTVWTTDDEAAAVARLPAIHSIVLVTSAFHMPRATMLFRARGLKVIPFPEAERYPGQMGTDALS